jgi:2-amino-4-hydroxy-6-hydroxymethyldihydropteridine diphosphokinase
MSCNDGVIAYIGLGSNLGDSIARLKDGLRSLNDVPRTRVLRCSSLYRSAPVGRTDQPDFINAVCEAETALDPAALLRALLDVERRHGRIRDGEKGGPRTLDLDLLLYGERELHEPGLDLPHPRLHERAFVLLPLAELTPRLAIPGRGPVAVLADAVRDQRIERLPGGGACEPPGATRQCRT